MSKTRPLPNTLLDPKPRRLSAGVIVVVVLVLALASGVGVQYWRGHSTVTVDTTSAVPEPAMITMVDDDARGVSGTPTVFVNNKMLNADQLTPAGLTAAVGAD